MKLEPKYIQRPEIVIDCNDTSTEIFRIEHLKIKFRNNKKDISAICYKNRKLNWNIYYVDEASLDYGRKISLEKFINSVRHDRKKLIQTEQLVFFFNYIDYKSNKEIDFLKFESVLEFYNSYTDYLINLIKLKKRPNTPTEAISQDIGAKRQYAAALFISTVFEKDLLVVKSSALEIQYKYRGNGQQNEIKVTSLIDQQSRYLEAFIDTAHKILVENKEFPQPFHFDDKTVYLHFWPIIKTEEGYASYVLEESQPLTHEDWIRLISPQKIKRATTYNIRRQEEANDINSKLGRYVRAELATMAMRAGVNFLAHSSGTNITQILNIKIIDLDFQPTTKGFRALKTKSRANDRHVPFEIPARHTPILKKVLEIRNYITDFTDQNSQYLCIRASLQPGNQVNRTLVRMRLNDFIKDNSTERILKYLTKGDFNWIKQREARNKRGNKILKSTSGDIYKTSILQGHSEKTAREKYLNSSDEEQVLEILEFFAKVSEAKIRATRVKDKIDVSIADNNQPTENRPAGGCISPSRPKLIDGFTKSAPQPDCLSHENCLFCDKYALKPKQEDIRKLFSIQYLVAQMSKTSITLEEYLEIWQPYFDRINEIIEKLLEKHDDLLDITNQIHSEVFENEELDEFWTIHLDSMYQL